jgi:hypothetical protein
MYLKAAFLFAQEIGKFCALTSLDLVSWITQRRNDIKILEISAVDRKTMLFLCISIKKFPNLVKLSLSKSSILKRRRRPLPITTVCPYQDSLLQVHIMGFSLCMCPVKKRQWLACISGVISENQNVSTIYNSHFMMFWNKLLNILLKSLHCCHTLL